MLRIREVKTSSEWSDFIDLPWKIYKDDSNWVPPLKVAVRKLLDFKKNPFFKHAQVFPLLAYQDEAPVGRILGIIDSNHNEFHQEKTGFFGFFESVPDPKVSKLLLSTVENWLGSKGINTMRGPFNPSVNHECGLLVKGYSSPPQIMMTYNPRYYPAFFEEFGFKKAKDFLAWEIDLRTRFSDRIQKQARRLRQKNSIRLRPLSLRNFDQDLKLLFQMTNESLNDVWGFVPMTWDEFRFAAEDLKAIVDPNLVLFVEYHGKAIGFGLALPDVNQALTKIKDGKLFPTGLLKFLWHTKGPGRKKTINRCRIILLCIQKEYQNLGLGPLLYTEYLKIGPQLGYQMGEASFVVEDNHPMIQALKMMNSDLSKVYRIYEKEVNY